MVPCTSILIHRAVGRPRVRVDIEDIEFLHGLRFPFTQIAAILGISRSTLYRRLEEGISRYCKYTDITDVNLDREIVDIKMEHPNDGERLLIGHLTRRGIIVPRTRVRASIHRVDPENTALRRSVTIRRRVYHVDGPNSLWHVDGNHKLIKWRMVIHGGIDGFSRTVVFLRCADNNRASTVLTAFTNAVQNHGLPERIRTYLGGENVDTWRYMVEQHASMNVVVTGSSTHNERIERLWRDVFRCVGSLYRDTFCMLEEESHLNPLNEIDLYCLLYVFIPRINSTLDGFVESWNNHALSTENNLTPNQLFIRGAIEQRMRPVFPNNEGAPTNGSEANSLPSTSNHVAVPRVSFVPCPLLHYEITSRVDPLDSSNDFGCDLYKRSVSIVGNHLLSGCTSCSM